ncbi:MAG TPA: hypothetical protein VNX00_08350 [Herbaspirillum sp.]|nr:hypothetical protein [Herbaspirillum sp.]
MKTIVLREKTEEQLAKLEKIKKDAFERRSAFRVKRLTEQLEQLERDPDFFKKKSSKREFFACWLQPETPVKPTENAALKRNEIAESLTQTPIAKPLTARVTPAVTYPAKPLIMAAAPPENEMPASSAQAFVPASNNLVTGNVGAQPRPYTINLETSRPYTLDLEAFKQLDLDPKILSRDFGVSKERPAKASSRLEKPHQENMLRETQAGNSKQRLLAPETPQLLVKTSAVTYSAKPVMAVAAAQTRIKSAGYSRIEETKKPITTGALRNVPTLIAMWEDKARENALKR